MVETLELEADLLERLRFLAESKQCSVESVVQEAIRIYVEKQEARQSFERAGLEALEEYRRTGLHVTVEEVFDWLDTWGTDEESEPPTPHT